MIKRFQKPLKRSLDGLNVTAAEKAEIKRALLAYYDYNDKTYEDVLKTAAMVLGTSVESLEIEGARRYTDDGLRFCPPFSFVNMGDPYTVTLARDHENSAWVVASWADLAEEYERDNELGDYDPNRERD